MPQLMSPAEIRARFPRVSQSVLEANSGFVFQPQIVAPAQSAKVQKMIRTSKMNGTESQYALILEAMKRRGDIADYQFEGMTIRLADNCKYTPDFFILVSLVPLKIRFAETKGAHIWDDSKVKFKVAKEQNPWAEWEMHQRKQGEWARIL